MPVPAILVLLAAIALLLHILINYLIPPAWVTSNNVRCAIAWVIVIFTLIFWFLVPLRVGG